MSTDVCLFVSADDNNQCQANPAKAMAFVLGRTLWVVCAAKNVQTLSSSSPSLDVTPPDLACPSDLIATAKPDRHYAIVDLTLPNVTGR